MSEYYITEVSNTVKLFDGRWSSDGTSNMDKTGFITRTGVSNPSTINPPINPPDVGFYREWNWELLDNRLLTDPSSITNMIVPESGFNVLAGWTGTISYSSLSDETGDGGTAEQVNVDSPALYVYYNGSWVDVNTNPGGIFAEQSNGKYYTTPTGSSGTGDKIQYYFAYKFGFNGTTIPSEFLQVVNGVQNVLRFLLVFIKDSYNVDNNVTSNQFLTYQTPSVRVEDVWETRTGSLVPGEWNLTSRFQNFPMLKRVLQSTPWLNSKKDIKFYYNDTVVFSGMYTAYALQKGKCLLGLSTYDSYSAGGQALGAGIVLVGEDGKFVALEVESNMSTLISKIKSNPDDYNVYRAPSDYFVMLDVIAGGGGGGYGREMLDEGAGGGGGGAGGSCRLVVFVRKGELLLFEAGKGGNSGQDGWESRVCVLSSTNGVKGGVVCDGGHAGFSATSHEGQFGGGNGGAVYWAAADGVSMGDNITYENGAGTTVVQWDATTDNDTGLSRGYIYVIFAATGGWGGHGGDYRIIYDNILPSQRGWQPLLSSSPVNLFTSFKMITNSLSSVTFSCKSVGTSGAVFDEHGSSGGCGGWPINTWAVSSGGDGGRRPGSGTPQPQGKAGTLGGGGGGAFAFRGTNSPGVGGQGIIYVSR